MSKLKEGELLAWLEIFNASYQDMARQFDKTPDKKEWKDAEQAFKQIKEMIKNVPWKKLELLLRLNEKLRADKKGLIADYKYALSKIPEKPEVTGEWIELKAYRLFARLLNINGTFLEAAGMRSAIKDFIRSLAKEIQGVEIVGK